MIKKLPNPHPGETLKDFLDDMGISQYKVAKDINVSPRRINEIVHGKRAITTDTGLRLDTYFSLSEGYFSRLQLLYDMEETKHAIKNDLRKIIRHSEKHDNLHV